jgi:hypothetical protein
MRETVYLIERHDLEGGTHYYRQMTRDRHTWTTDPHMAMQFGAREDAQREAYKASGLVVCEHIFGLDLHERTIVIGTVFVCAGPPQCSLQDDEAVQAARAGCRNCRRIAVHDEANND